METIALTASALLFLVSAGFVMVDVHLRTQPRYRRRPQRAQVGSDALPGREAMS